MIKNKPEEKERCPNCGKFSKHIGLCFFCGHYFCEHCIDEHYNKMGLGGIEN